MVMLQLWSNGADVRRVQEMLNVAIDDDPPLKVDGIFGPKTKARVVQFQKTFKLFADGVVGPKTAKALVAAVLDAVQDNA